MTEDSRTIEDLCKEAIDIQGACNLSGVVLSFSRAILRLRRIYIDEGTDFYNSHCVCVMYSSKISSLTNSESSLNFSRSYEECIKIRDGK